MPSFSGDIRPLIICRVVHDLGQQSLPLCLQWDLRYHTNSQDVKRNVNYIYSPCYPKGIFGGQFQADSGIWWSTIYVYDQILHSNLGYLALILSISSWSSHQFRYLITRSFQADSGGCYFHNGTWATWLGKREPNLSLATTNLECHLTTFLQNFHGYSCVFLRAGPPQTWAYGWWIQRSS